MDAGGRYGRGVRGEGVGERLVRADHVDLAAAGQVLEPIAATAVQGLAVHHLPVPVGVRRRDARDRAAVGALPKIGQHGLRLGGGAVQPDQVHFGCRLLVRLLCAGDHGEGGLALGVAGRDRRALVPVDRGPRQHDAQRAALQRRVRLAVILGRRQDGRRRRLPDGGRVAVAPREVGVARDEVALGQRGEERLALALRDGAWPDHDGVPAVDRPDDERLERTVAARVGDGFVGALPTGQRDPVTVADLLEAVGRSGRG